MTKTIREQKQCYLSTPEHTRSFMGMFLYIYTAKGSLSLTSESLIFTSKKISFEIPLHSIVEISSDHYSRIAKPIRLDYIAIKYRHQEEKETILFTQTILLTPTQSWATPVWKTNKTVASWVSSLNDAIQMP